MSIWSQIVGGGVVGAAEGIANIIDKFVQTDEEKAAAELLRAKIMAEPMLAQIELNKIEARHRTIFVAGWRPFIGWVCGLSLAWHFLLFDLLTWVQVNFFPAAVTLPDLSGTETLVTIVLSLLGLGAFRTVEKLTGRAQ